MSQGIVSKGNSPCSFSFQIILLGGGCKVSININLYASVPNWIQEIPNHVKIQEMCVEAVHIKLYSLKFVLTALKSRKCVINQLKGSYMHWNISLRSIRCERFVKELFEGCHLHWIMFLSSIRPRKCVPKSYLRKGEM